MKRRNFISSALTLGAGASLYSSAMQAQDLSPHQPRDWSGNTPLRYPDPDLIALDNRFRFYILFNTPI